MYDNFKVHHKGDYLMKMLWNASMSFTQFEFAQYMELIREESEDAYKWLAAIGPEKWSRSAFSTTSKCDLVVNNVSESFNKYIRQAREKPVITMLETIRKQLMRRLQKKKEKMNAYEGSICPKILRKLEKLEPISRYRVLDYA